MQVFLQELVVGNIFAFLIILMRFGIALMLMPGIGDAFVAPQVRLSFALAMCFILTPVLAPHLPKIPGSTVALLSLLLSEAFVGLFIGTIMRIMVSALDTAGAMISAQAGFSNAILFNPTTGAQGSIMGAVYSALGVTLLLVTNLHQQLLAGVAESYILYPATGVFLDTGAVSEGISRIATTAFTVGVQISIPFIVVGTLAQVGFGVLGRLMPQAQVFFLVMPVQIFLSLILLAMTLSVGIMYWLSGYDDVVFQTINPG